MKKIHEEFLKEHGHKFTSEQIERFKQESLESESKTSCDYNKRFKDGCNSTEIFVAKCVGKCKENNENL